MEIQVRPEHSLVAGDTPALRASAAAVAATDAALLPFDRGGSRRSLLLGATLAPLLAWTGTGKAAAEGAALQESTASQLAALEKESGGRLGVFASGRALRQPVGYREHERFPVCSTFKLLAAGAILRRSEHDAGLLQRSVHYRQADLVAYSPITQQHLREGMTVAELCAAALRYSDNTAGNQLLKILGGPPAVTAFARAIGDTAFRLDRWETALNTAIPGDARDTCTPAGMAGNLDRLVLQDTLGSGRRQQLETWLRGNTTGATRIRAGLPAGWAVADKTGAGDYGTVNDIGVVWTPAGVPMVLAVYLTQPLKDAPGRNDVVASAARIVAAQALG